MLFDPNDEKTVAESQLLWSGDLSGVAAKTVLQIYWEEASSKPLAAWCTLAGLAEADVVDVAREFTAHGRRAVADLHRGVSQHTNGFYNVVAWYTVNTLIGNHDWMGGLSKATNFNYDGSSPGKPYDCLAHPAKFKGWGVSIIRHQAAYDKSTLFSGYPAKRVWYPFCSDIYQEVIPSAGDGYPYPLKCLLLYMGTPVYSLPAGHEIAKILADPKKIPLFITSDITVGETSLFADYVFPDVTYLERWEFVGSHPSMTPKVGAIRQPAAAPLTDSCTVYGQRMPICLESMLLGLAEKMGLAGFGENGFGPGRHLRHMDDMYLPMCANMAFGDKPDGSEKIPAADKAEMDIFLAARKHLPPAVFDAKRWEGLVGPELWPSVVAMLNRGGRYQAYDKAYKDGQLVNKYGKMVGLYFENMVKAKDSMTGKAYLPYGGYLPSPLDATGKPLEDVAAGYDLTMITYKAVTQTKSRTSGDYWLQAPYPENFVELSAADAARLGFKAGDAVKIVSASNTEGVWDLGPFGKKFMIGKVRILEGLRPGVTAFSLGHGTGPTAPGSGKLTARPLCPTRAGPRACTAMRPCGWTRCSKTPASWTRWADRRCFTKPR